jgi:hypothetical protein
MEKICEVCHKSYKTIFPQQKTCSQTCRLVKAKIHYVKVPYNLPTGTIGAISELRVAADLLAKGYEVFRALSPSCSCDLAILQKGKLLRVEVRTGNCQSGRVYCRDSNNEKHDVFAVVNNITGEIIYTGLPL